MLKASLSITFAVSSHLSKLSFSSSNRLAEIKSYAETTDQTHLILPVSPDALGIQIDRIKPLLRKKGISINRFRANDKNRTRLISIEGCVF